MKSPLEQIGQLKYKVENKKTDYQGMLIVGVIFIGVILMLVFRTLPVALIILLFILIALRLYFIPSGVLEFYFDNDDFYIVNNIRGKEDPPFQKVLNKKFRWSYNYLVLSESDGVNGSKSAGTLSLLRLEIELEDSERIAICHELNVWSSTPHWTYEIFKKEAYSKIFLSSSKLKKLKETIEAIEKKK